MNGRSRERAEARAAVTPDVVRDYAAEHDVCVRPVIRTVTDRETGETTSVHIACGSTRESKCPPCAKKAQRLRMQQCEEGWHLEEDPLPPEEPAKGTAATDGEDQDEDQDEDQERRDDGSRRVRSTRRRSDVDELPKVPQEHRSIGRTFTAPDGTTYRPSMFVTLTLGSYGRVKPSGLQERKSGPHGGGPAHGMRAPVKGGGCPLDPGSYDYRRAALEAMFFPRLFDRWMQNLRRCAGYKVQYFGAIEPQRRLAPHIHLAMRGAIPRKLLKQVTKATYLQLWWPSFEDAVYTDPDRYPTWDLQERCYRDADTGVPLTDWKTALDRLADDPEAEPAVVMRLGAQTDIQGVIAGSTECRAQVRYLAKYLTKDVAHTYADPDDPDLEYLAHIDRLHQQLLYLPCGETCANWLRYGIVPKDAGPGLVPGMCPNKAHDRENLGLGGRRVQVSRAWSGKTLKEHKADRATVVREVLKEAGIDPPDAERMAADVLAGDGLPRFVWEDVPVAERDYVTVILNTVREKQRWRAEYDAARDLARQRTSAGGARASPVSTWQ